ncbi:uncharacterized protein LOC124500632 isoform X2 [Dermatophagoides farinae]|uniref:uncharacterized protein LOC124500632 isoform X2 n=1 Tax=Dermatophagoides farinae TaxID=6954 RepID=UPI003F639AA0
MKIEQSIQKLNINSTNSTTTMTTMASSTSPPSTSSLYTYNDVTSQQQQQQPIHWNPNPFQQQHWQTTNLVPTHYPPLQHQNNFQAQSFFIQHQGIFPQSPPIPPPPPPTFLIGTMPMINHQSIVPPSSSSSSQHHHQQQQQQQSAFNNQFYDKNYPEMPMVNNSNYELQQQLSNFSINNNYNMNDDDHIQRPQQQQHSQQFNRSTATTTTTTNELLNNKSMDQKRLPTNNNSRKPNWTKINVNDLFEMSKPNFRNNRRLLNDDHHHALLPTPSTATTATNSIHHQYFNNTNTSGGDFGGGTNNDRKNVNKNRQKRLFMNKDDENRLKFNNEEPRRQQQQQQQEQQEEQLKRLKLNRLEDKHLENILAKFGHDLIETECHIQRIISSYSQRTCTYLYSIIWIYFEHLEQRLNFHHDNNDPNTLSYTDLLDGRQYQYTDFCSYGKRFQIFLNHSNWFKPIELEQFLCLIKHYEKLHPKDILEFRQYLLHLRLQLQRNNRNNNNNNYFNRSIKLNYSIDYRSVTYETFDQRMLYNNVIQLNGFKEKFNEFNSTYSLSKESRSHMMKFVQMFEQMLYTHFEQFRPRVHTFGSISNGLGTSNSDFDLFIQFEKINADILDFHTSMMALEVIEKLMKIEFGLQLRNDQSTIIHSRRCPIIKLNFHQCLRHLKLEMPRQQQMRMEFTKCDISIVSMYGVHNSRLLNFFTRYDRRFYELTMALKYWAKTNELISTHMFSTYAFTMLIVFFLQQQDPPILPTVGYLNRLAKKSKNSKKQILHRWDFNFYDDDIELIGRSKNRKSTPSLFVEFFKPRQGVHINKYKLAAEKEINNFHTFNMSSFFCIEDPFVLDHNVAYNVRTRNVHRFFVCLKTVADRIDENNCLDILLEKQLSWDQNPDIFPPCNLYRYELILNEDDCQYELRQRKKSLKTFNDVDQMWQLIMKFFHHIIDQLLTNYFFMPTFTLNLSQHDHMISCHPHWPTLDKIIHSQHWQQLSQFVQSKTPGSIDLLRCFRKRFRKELNEFENQRANNNTINNSDDDNDDNEEWFNISYSYRPGDSNNFANFNVQAVRSSTFAVLDVVIATLQTFFHAIDRSDPMETFGQCYHRFLLNADDD